MGVSRDSVESHRKFKAKYGFPFPLLADTEGAFANAMGVLVENRVSRLDEVFASLP